MQCHERISHLSSWDMRQACSQLRTHTLTVYCIHISVAFFFLPLTIEVFIYKDRVKVNQSYCRKPPRSTKTWRYKAEVKRTWNCFFWFVFGFLERQYTMWRFIDFTLDSLILSHFLTSTPMERNNDRHLLRWILPNKPGLSYRGLRLTVNPFTTRKTLTRFLVDFLFCF